MNPRRSYAAGTGLFILLGFAALAYLATQTTSLVNFDSGPSYDVTAEFTSLQPDPRRLLRQDHDQRLAG